MTQDALDAEMVGYYACRANEYDDWYLRKGRYARGEAGDAAWRSDLAVARHWLEVLEVRGDVLEIAAGTGWWSSTLATKGRLTVSDASPEPLIHARRRLEAAGLAAEFVVRDAWAEPDRRVDCLFTGFWLSHVARERLFEFFELARRWLVPGGLYAFIDSRQDSESGAVDHSAPQDDVQERKLDDGSVFRVRKIYYSPAEFGAALTAAGFRDVRVGGTDRFFVIGSARS